MIGTYWFSSPETSDLFELTASAARTSLEGQPLDSGYVQNSTIQGQMLQNWIQQQIQNFNNGNGGYGVLQFQMESWDEPAYFAVKNMTRFQKGRDGLKERLEFYARCRLIQAKLLREE